MSNKRKTLNKLLKQYKNDQITFTQVGNDIWHLFHPFDVLFHPNENNLPETKYTKNEIYNILNEKISDFYYNITFDYLNPEDIHAYNPNLYTDWKFDELDIMELLINIEKEFEIVEELNIDDINNVLDFYNHVYSTLQMQNRLKI